MKQNRLLLFLLLMSFSIGVRGYTVNIIGCGQIVDVSNDGCDALHICVTVKPDPGFTTCLDWITVTKKQLEVNIQHLEAETLLKIPLKLILILIIILMVLNVYVLYLLLSQTLQT